MRDPLHEMTLDGLLGRPLNEVEQKYAPQRLFVAGKPEIIDFGIRVSIVGSRNASPSGLHRARKLARLVCVRGGLVISGLAAGIDTAAHKGAMEKGRTVAVLGTPLNKYYPKENEKLQAEIMQEHLCLSQFPIGYPVQPKNFPIRNRTMALLSDATVIIEAGEGSGSLSQGWEALRLGRGLFIAKSVVENPDLSWPKKMLGYGARILADDSLDEFYDSLPERNFELLVDGSSF